MKNLFFAFLMLIAFGMSQCRKDAPAEPVDVVSIDTAEVKIYLNGNLTNYAPYFITYRGSGAISYGFRQVRGVYQNNVGPYGPVSLATGDFGKNLFFQQYHHLDYGNHKYEHFEKETAFFKVTKIDTTMKAVKGSFQAKFKRKSSGIMTTDSYLPDTLSFKGTFDTKYTEY